ncbi:hypothetical protein AVEN_159827-1 [Araneus ventricosus]|uniref:Uncharacterized protein n=1 Tax=Araneus ventricosus TaxID=182803 RepID=A0A4Y2T7D6_ARAVE|nr:hypothetical protein AVEN_244853-1 [Araneus ventricosus]GBN95861.1 hypothetical protein AVEN_84301-1 [Araneus ventricosus]GBN95862.1 hypothetical protein AVEN_189617-1 [Araneus ventricosus]GBN95885.1 hypothetical protein AVEN_159827-1 [Araneus ventricosus]
MSLLDESRWKKHGERYATVITDDRGNAARLRSSMCDREQLLFAARVDIDVYDTSGNIAHIADHGDSDAVYDADPGLLLRRERGYDLPRCPAVHVRQEGTAACGSLHHPHSLLRLHRDVNRYWGPDRQP